MNKTLTYTYDARGNILSKKEYPFTTGTLSGTAVTKNYTYGSQTWSDLLTQYNGTSITYDTVGNPNNWRDVMTFTWQHGRQLKQVSKNGVTTAYQYNDSGIRTQKTVGGTATEYFLEGSRIIAQKTGNDIMWFYYDANGVRDAVMYNGNTYYYFYNGQGDVLGLFDQNLNVVVNYTYDSWGNPLSTTGSMASTLGAANPFRYRGYYYDTETGLYYLQSRYYDPVVGRFINADGYVTTGQGLTSFNMFAYCGNNPVNRVDSFGCLPQFLEDGWNWFHEKVVQPVGKFVGDVIKDVKNFDFDNESEDNVISANYISAYKNTIVIKLPFLNGNAASFGIIVIGDEVTTTDIKHEYGHKVQFDKKGVIRFAWDVAVPSVAANLCDRLGLIPYDYYSSPWEAEADRLGGVNRELYSPEYPKESYVYYSLYELFGEIVRTII